MVTERDYDVVVLGAGSGGYAAALRAADLGKSVALVEADKVGGTCLHRGCIPTKALLHAAEVADTVRASSTVGVHADLASIDVDAMNSYKDGIVRRLHQGLNGLVSAHGIEVVPGWGRLVEPLVVEVDGQRLRGADVVLATGSEARSLPGLEIGGRVITSDQAVAMDWVPATAVVLGGGVIGVELASVWRSLGAEVTIIEALPHLLPQEDPDLSTGLERAFRKRGIGQRLGTRFDSATQDDGGVTVTLEGGEVLEAEVLLVAVGRGPRTDGLGLAENGVRLDERGHVVVDEQLHSSVDHVWAVGDITPGLQLAHRGFAHGIYVAEQIAGMSPAPVVDAEIPRVTYCDPEVASVGLTEARAREVYGDVEVVQYNLGGNGKSQILGTGGFVKLVRAAAGPVVGAHLLGARMGEQIGQAQLMVSWEAYPEDVASLLHAHPTQNESLGEAAMALAGKPLHSHA